jgi:hypothetical protein
MSGLNALFSAAFLILVAASVAVTGSMVMLGLIDSIFRKKKEPEPEGEELPTDGQEADQYGNNDKGDAALENLDAEQMSKFSARQNAPKRLAS